jgi:hypothetical protein
MSGGGGVHAPRRQSDDYDNKNVAINFDNVTDIVCIIMTLPSLRLAYILWHQHIASSQKARHRPHTPYFNGNRLDGL